MKNFFTHIKWREVMTFLLFFVLAALVWYGHAMNSVRNTRVPVLIQYTGKPDAIGLGGQLPDTVFVEIRDAGARLNTYHRDHLRLTIDLRPYIHGEKGTIHVPSDALRRSISDILQGTSRLISTMPEEISCPYFTEQEKTVKISPAYTLTLADEYQLVGKPTLSRKRVKLYGQDKALAAIDSICTESVELKGISDTLSQRLALVLPEHVRADIDSVTLNIVTERFTEKRFLVPITLHGVPESKQIRLFPNEVEVRVRMGISHFSQVQASDIRAICTYSSKRIDKLDVELRYTNPHITAAWAYPGVVEFLVE